MPHQYVENIRRALNFRRRMAIFSLRPKIRQPISVTQANEVLLDLEFGSRGENTYRVK